MIIRGQNATGNIVEHEITPLSDEEIARRKAIREAKRAPAVNPRDALLDLVVSRMLDSGALEPDAVVATGAKVSVVVSDKLQLFATGIKTVKQV